MNTFRMQLLATGLLAGTLAQQVLAAEPATPPQTMEQQRQEMEKLQQGMERDRQEMEKRMQDEQKRMAEARERLERSTAEVADLSRQMGRDYTRRFSAYGPGATPRSLLGVMLESAEQKDGAHVREVSPGGAAAEAGIKPGDVIISIGGQDLTKDAAPGRSLVERMGQIEPNVKTQVGVLRGGRKLTFDVTPRPAPALALMAVPGRDQDLPGLKREFLDRMATVGARAGRREDDGTRFAGLEFASVSEKLGGYFGVKSGVLVVRSGVNSPMKLQDGDVILAIDGREPSSAQHAARILRSYSPGEKATLRVQRDRKAQNVEITMPNEGREDVFIRTP